MILIDKELIEQEIILTGDGETDSDAKLVLVHDETRKQFEILLGENTSPFIERYDRFFVSTELFDNLPEGLFSYKIYNSERQVALFETGKLYIKPSKFQEEIIAAKSPINDILVFTNK